MRPIVRRSVRALIIDADRRLVLIKRTRPGQDVYWTTPGGGVEATDESLLAALARELAEELGAETAAVTRVLVTSSPTVGGVQVHHYYACRLVKLDEGRRHGPELSDESRGAYDIDRVPIEDVQSVALKPPALRDFIAANVEALLDAAGAG